MNHADFCVIPMARWTSYELMPFLQFTICHIAASHLSRPSGESSKMVPVFDVNCRLGWRLPHCQRLYFARNVTLEPAQRGHMTPFGQRRSTRYSRQLSGLEKYTMAS